MEINSESLQGDLLQLVPTDSDKSKSALFLVARPLGNRPILDLAAGHVRIPQLLEGIMKSQDAIPLFRQSPFGSLRGRSLSSGWQFECRFDDHLDGHRTLVPRLSRNGTCELFHNDLAVVDNTKRKLLQHSSLVETARRFLWITAAIYRKASFWGAIDLGALVTVLSESRLVVRNSIKGQYFDADNIFKASRMPAGNLSSHSNEVIRELFSDYYYGLDLDPETLPSEALASP